MSVPGAAVAPSLTRTDPNPPLAIPAPPRPTEEPDRRAAEARSPKIPLYCPQCRRFLLDVQDFVRVICSRCRCEITYRSKEQRAMEEGQPVPVVTV